jgi:immune inhibitor A
MSSSSEPEENQPSTGIVACWPERCLVAPHPDLAERMKAEVARFSESELFGSARIVARRPDHLGFDDGVIIPPQLFPLGTPEMVVRAAAAERAPLRGAVRVIVVLVDFADRPMAQTQQHYRDLFFSSGVLPNGSVSEFYNEASGGLVQITGDVVGPFRLPRNLADYAHGASGTGATTPNAQTMARDAVTAANPTVNFASFDNDGNGFVDAFIVIHSGGGAEQTGSVNDIWSHKWTLDGGAFNADGTQIFAYLTVPEDARVGVCAHELGHLLFGWPDLYDTDGSSEGIGNWCLMAGGSWNGPVAGTPAGDVPAHPSAWCKVNQGWVSVVNQTTNATVPIVEVKNARTVYRLWKDGGSGSEYFLVENRQRLLFDRALPGEGLLIWHIDEAVATNKNEAHYKVALIQADNLKQLEGGTNRGDAGDPYPGSINKTSFTDATSPSSKSYAGQNTCVGVTSIGATGSSISAKLQVSCIVKVKELSKETAKELRKESKEYKEFFKESKEFRKEFKEIRKEAMKDTKEFAREKDFDNKLPDVFDPRAGFPTGAAGQTGGEDWYEQAEPFIGRELRPDVGTASFEQTWSDDLQQRMRQGDRTAKLEYDVKPRER